MPAKKKATAKNKTVTKKKTAKKVTSKKTATKKAFKKVATKKKTVVKSKPVPQKKVAEIVAATPPPVKIPEKPKKEKKGIPCQHCDATGVCAAGKLYDKSRGMVFGSKTRLTSCYECLAKAGEHKNSKKLVDCRLCDGDGKI
jgi:hypothetical protein